MKRWLPPVAFLLFFLLYLRTLVPGLFEADFAEFQYMPANLGLPHPNGFPSYMLLGWLWSHLPLGNLAWRMNLLSAVGGAACVAVTVAFLLRVTRRSSVALLGGGLLGLGATFWGYSVVAERYTLNLALLAATVWTAWEAARRRDARIGWLSAALLGLGLATHPSDALLVPFWAFYLLWQLGSLHPKTGLAAGATPAPADTPDSPRSGSAGQIWRGWLGLLLALGSPLLLYLYVPLRWLFYSHLPLLPGIGRSVAVFRGLVHVWYEPVLTLGLLRDYVLGVGDYAVGLVAGGWQQALGGLGNLAPSWLADMSWPLMALGLAGGLSLLRRDRALAFLTGGFALLDVVMTAYIRQGKNSAYLLPAFWVIYLWSAFGLDLVMNLSLRLLERTRRRTAAPGTGRADVAPRARPAVAWPFRCAVLGVSGLLFLLAWSRYPQQDMSRATETRAWWDVALLHPLEPGAALLGHWGDLTPLWYLQQVEDRRPDLLGLFPPDPANVIDPWLASGQALYLAAPLHGWAPDLAERYSLLPWGRLVRILPREPAPRQQAAGCPPQPSAAGLDPTGWPEGWPIQITSWDFALPPGADTPGAAPGALLFCWQARGEVPPDTFLRVRLNLSPDQPDLVFNEPLLPEWYPRQNVPAGSPGLAVLPVRLPLGAAPGIYTAQLLLYRLSDDGTIQAWPGVTEAPLGEITIDASYHFTRAGLGNEMVTPLIAPRAGPLVLRAWQVSHEAVRPGDPIRLELLWEVRQPLSERLTLSAGFRAPLQGGRLVAPPQQLPVVLAAQGAQPGLLLRTVHILSAPRGQGDHSYALELRVQSGERWLDWQPGLRLLVGSVRVNDRPHLYVLPDSATVSQFRLGQLAQLAGSDVETSTIRPGGLLPVTLYWRALSETDAKYNVFVHLLDAQGRLAAQHDGQPADGTLPTNLWISGELIPDSLSVALPDDLASGTYHLQAGLYSRETMQRLPVSDQHGVAAGDAIDLGTVVVP